MTATVLVILQARVESSRFPAKIISPILGIPMILWQLERISHMKTPHVCITALPDTQANREQLVPLLARHGHEYLAFPGNQDDVLARFAYVLEKFPCQSVVRLTADCPCFDPQLLDELLQYHHGHTQPHVIGRALLGVDGLAPIKPLRVDYLPDFTGLAVEWGDGFDMEIFTANSLMAAHKEATLMSDREHCGPYIYRQLQRFHCVSMPCPFDLSWLRLSVDTPADLALVTTILTALLDRYGLTYGWREVWQTVERFPDLKAQMRARVHNAAYVAQVAQETGAQVDWATLRYGGHV